ncbi:hypothetical protein CAFE_02350 [Caprobacter fermentans]|uniref:DUF6273 domain-containing protein n=1 Tax=Caproicibacter fermentans TaxID=2576756 RepID=A0A6N8HV77_9FIRM|nr:DUF6273 domain-containing protein [Caproicibacter fermentans]MVB09579.1 hypothetical protein [Caproicibacter fermentans]
MAESSGFFRSVGGDRKYTVDFLAEWVASFLSNGVYTDALAVTADANMQVLVPSGQAWINGYYYRSDADIPFQIRNADGVLNRKDTVVLRWDLNKRSISAQILTGAPASNPVAPAIVRTAEQYDLKLAEISVPAGTTAITQSLITDTRLDNNVCGIVHAVVDRIDTTTFYNQIAADLAEFKSTNESDFTAWFNGIKNILDENAAGNLLAKINDLAGDGRTTETVKANADTIAAHVARTDNPHGVTAEQAGAVKGNTASYRATAVTSTDAWSQTLTIPNFIFSEGCQVTFKAVQTPKDDSTPDATRVIINGKGYCLLDTKRGTLPSDAWVIGAAVTVTLSNDAPLGWGAANGCGTAFFKQGGYGTLAAQINNFYATIGDASVRLTWSNPADGNYAGVVIIRKTGGYPSKVLDGTKIYDGTGTSFTDTGLTNGTQYYYRAFSYNSKKEYQTEYCVATMTPLHGYQLGTFPVGTKLKFGSIFGNPIVMKIANKSGSDITLIADGVLARYAFDAKEPSNSVTDRKNYGNNRYTLSNIHQWLNSEAGAGSWYVAQHSVDQAPDSTSVVSANPYKSVAGFLNGFSVKEKNYLKTKTITVGRPNTDGGGTETLNARICLPSGTEVGLSTDYTEGSQLQAFSDNNSRIAYETADCAANTGGTAGAAQYYWLRTPYASRAYSVRVVCSDGTLGDYDAYSGTGGVRPLCFLDSSVLISLTPDASGAYTVL